MVLIPFGSGLGGFGTIAITVQTRSLNPFWFRAGGVDDAAMSVAEVKQTKEGLAIKLHDKKGALDSIAKHLGMFTDKMEVTHKEAPVLQVILSGD